MKNIEAIHKHCKDFNLIPPKGVLENVEKCDSITFNCNTESKNNYILVFSEHNIQKALETFESLIDKSIIYDKIKEANSIFNVSSRVLSRKSIDDVSIRISEDGIGLIFPSSDANNLSKFIDYQGPLWYQVTNSQLPTYFELYVSNDGEEELAILFPFDFFECCRNHPFWKSSPLGFMEYPSDVEKIYLEYRCNCSSIIIGIREPKSLDTIMPTAPIPSHIKQNVSSISFDYDQFKGGIVKDFGYMYSYNK